MPSFHILIAATGFSVALAVKLGAAGAFAARLDRLGAGLGLTEALIGVLTALAADSPELASSVSAIVRGQRDVGLGVACAGVVASACRCRASARVAFRPSLSSSASINVDKPFVSM